MSLTEIVIPSEVNGTRCLKCRGRIVVDVERGEIVCSGCGIVFPSGHDVTLQKEEHVAFEKNHYFLDYSKTSNYQLTTIIDQRNVDASGNRIHKFSEFDKLRKLNTMTISDSKTRNLNKALKEISRIIQVLGISRTVGDRAYYIYKKAKLSGLIKGRSITGIVGACIYIASNELGIPCSIEEIKRHLGEIKKKTLLHYYKTISKNLDLEAVSITQAGIISKIAKKARLSVKTERKGFEIYNKVKDNQELGGKRPNSIAAASLYIASIMTKEKTTQLRLANASDLTPMTIRKRYFEIQKLITDSVKQKEQLASNVNNPIHIAIPLIKSK